MRKIVLLIVVLLLAVAPGAAAAPALKQPDQARRIMDENINRDDGTTRYRQVMLVTCRYDDKQGRRTCRSRPVQKRIESLTRDVGEHQADTIGLGIITDPPSEKDMAFLQKDYDQPGRASDQWMYFPALKKLKRIISQGDSRPKTGSVFGSEIAYEDLEKRHLVDYSYSLDGVDTVDGRQCDRIIAYPTAAKAPKTSYAREVNWIDRETRIAVKRECYDKRGRLVKTFYRRGIVRRKGVWLDTVFIVVNHQTRHMTMEKTGPMAVNIPIDAELVGQRALRDAAFRESGLRPLREQAE